MNELMKYQESIVDIIHAIHTMKQLTPRELYVILEMSKCSYVPTTSQIELYYEFERRLEHCPDDMDLILTKEDNHVVYYTIEQLEKDAKLIEKLLEKAGAIIHATDLSNIETVPKFINEDNINVDEMPSNLLAWSIYNNSDSPDNKKK